MLSGMARATALIRLGWLHQQYVFFVVATCALQVRGLCRKQFFVRALGIKAAQQQAQGPMQAMQAPGELGVQRHWLVALSELVSWHCACAVFEWLIPIAISL